MTAVQRAVTLIASLSEVERAQVMLAWKRLPNGGVVPLQAGGIPTKDWLAAGVEIELQRRGMPHHSLTTARIKDIAPDYASDAAVIRGDLEDKMRIAFNGAVKHTQLVALGAVVVRALGRKLETYRPVGIQALLTSVHLIPEAVEESFPGYLRCGMIGMLVRQR